MTAWAFFFDKPVPYLEAVRLQERLHAARCAETIPDTVLFLEHTPVITLGARGRTEHLLANAERLRELGIECHKASRGGDVTYHGPGQLVMYPILRLGSHEADAHSYLFNLEEIAVRTAADFDVRAYRRAGMNGAWTDSGKIAAIGFRLRRWVTLHGMSFNVSPNLGHFSLIVPCGLHGEPVSSLQAIMGERCPSVSDVQDRMAHHFETVCGRRLDLRPIAELTRVLSRPEDATP
jgi:lipoyl(octanoyl) transferase